MINKLRFYFFTLALLCIPACNLFGIAKQYQIVDLGLQEYTKSHPHCINNNGWITGQVSDNGYWSIFVIDRDKKIALRSHGSSSFLIINNSNEIFGTAMFSKNDGYWEFDDEEIFKWINPYKYWQWFHFYNLGSPNYSSAFTFRETTVWGANDLGQILVMDTSDRSAATSELNTKSVWIYDQGTFYKIAHPNVQAGFKLNNNSEVLGGYATGSALTKDRIVHLSIYNFNTKSVRLLNLPGSAIGKDLNDLGQAVGVFFHHDEEMWIGFLAEPTGEIIQMINFFPFAINNSGQIVGKYLYAEKQDRPAIWENGELYDLQNLTSMVDDEGNVWDSIASVTDINDEGWMVGEGKIGEKIHAILLKPLP